jgi:hypothetical protein
LGGRQGDPECHELAVRDIDITGAIRLPADVAHEESPAEEGMGRVGYLDLIRIRMRRVVEVGIVLSSRLTRFLMIG